MTSGINFIDIQSPDVQPHPVTLFLSDFSPTRSEITSFKSSYYSGYISHGHNVQTLSVHPHWISGLGLFLKGRKLTGQLTQRPFYGQVWAAPLLCHCQLGR